MKRMVLIAGALALALSAGGCSAFHALGLDQVAASAADSSVPASVQAPVANTAAAAENLYTGSVKVLTTAANNKVLTLDQINRIDPIENAVYNAIVTVRDDVKNGKDVSAALAIFNAAYGKLFTEAKADGVALPTEGASP